MRMGTLFQKTKTVMKFRTGQESPSKVKLLRVSANPQVKGGNWHSVEWI